MSEPNESDIEITTSDICLECGEDIANRAATSLCEICENRLLSHLPSRQYDEEIRDEQTDSDVETIETDTTSKGTVENDG